MSLVENLIPRRGRPPIPNGPEQAPPIAAKIAEAERQLDALRAEHPERALDVVNGVEGAEQQLADLTGRIAEQERRLETLRAAHSAALAADERMFRAQRAALYRTQVAAVERHLKARDEAAEKLRKAIQASTEAFRDVIEHSRQAERANPPCGRWPGYLGEGKIVEAVRQELWRVGGGDSPSFLSAPDRPPPPFPGGEPVSPVKRSPAACPELVKTLRDASEYVIRELNGRVPG